MLLLMNIDHPQPRKIAKAAELIRAGEILCYPTDTGYGLGCDPHQLKTVEKLFRMGNRSKEKPASLLCSNFKQIAQYAYIDDTSFRVAKRVLPGPYTLILKATKVVARRLHGKRKEVGIRYPNHPVVLALIEELGTPILNITARAPDGHYLDDPHEIDRIWGKQLGAVIGGDLLPKSPSTVIDLTGDEPEILRVGQGDPDVFF